MEAIRRIGLGFVLIALMASMVVLSALTGTAQNSGQYDAKTSGGSSGQYDGKTGGGSGPHEDEIYSSPQWLREYHQAQGWWYFWWYNWCYDAGDEEWFKIYGGWEWWGPVND